MRPLAPTIAVLALVSGCVDYDEAYSRGVEDGLTQLEGRVEAMEASVGGQGQQDLLDEVANQAYRIEDLEAGNNALEARVAALETSNSDLLSRLSALESTVAGLDVTAVEARVTALETSDATQDTDIAALQTNDGTQDGAISALQTNDGTQDAAISALQTSQGTQDADIAALQAADITHSSGINALQLADITHDSDIGDLQTSVGVQDTEIAALQGWESGSRAGYDAMQTEWTERFIDTAVVLDVPGTYADVNAALASLDRKRIVGDGWVTIQIADGAYLYTAPIDVRHPDGSRIEIAGNASDETAVVLNFAGVSGLTLWDGAHLGGLSGLTLRGDNTPNFNGIEVMYGSTLANGERVAVEQFGDHGVIAVWGSSITLNQSTSRDNGGEGVIAQYTSAINAANLVASGNGQGGAKISFNSTAYLGGATLDANNDQGIYAMGTSSVLAQSATASGSLGSHGFDAGHLSYLELGFAVADRNALSGVRVFNGSTAAAPFMQSTNNGQRGFYALYDSTLDAGNLTVSGNGDGSFYPNDPTASWTDSSTIHP